MTQAEINKQCGVFKDKAGNDLNTIACADIGGHKIYMPNPCTYPEVKDENSYAHLVCHEVAHTEGWKHTE